MASILPKMKQKGAERHAVNALGEDHPFAPLQFYYPFIFHALSFSLVRQDESYYHQPDHLLPPMAATEPGTPSCGSSNSLGSSGSHLPYTHEEALAFLKGKDKAREELGNVSRQSGVEQAKWEDQWKQFYNAIYLSRLPTR